MKTKKTTTLTALTLTALALTLVFASCAERSPSGYILEFPEVPAAWVYLLGEPHWRLEWINPEGQKQTADYPPAGNGKIEGIEIEIPITWTNPVTAWPYWPGFNLPPNTFKPAGVLFPFDTNGNYLDLTWEAGPDTVFFWELALASSENTVRNPANFDWPRFRELFKSETMNEAVRQDPWLVNWRSLAERTIASNFDRRRIVPEAVQLREFSVPKVTWYSTSPFAEPVAFTDEEPQFFPVRPGLNIWISTEGILRVNGNSWVFSAWK